ncbi:ATP-binding protein [Streptomyces sp. NPDC059272]|uniref:ATP-binding protein n=1 Tax=Streptomyces sp. NPDC059272 TaxID=3346800 RepID=UPI003689E40F
MGTMFSDAESSFVGRLEELDLIGAASTRSRMVTLTGPGGVGKTRLARQVISFGLVAAEDGVAWADLSPLRNPDLLGATVADALDLSDHTPRMPVEAICTWVGSRRALLVLDSCEHLLTECRDLAGNLLTACPNLLILATSREPLRLDAESVVEIDPLATAEEAIALFADRAASAGSPLKDDSDRQMAGVLCERLERLPLALELAAAQLRSMPLSQLCVSPGEAVDLPPTEGHTVPRRHAALRTTIGWSHELCTPLERLLWARLSFLPGSFDDSTAWQVAGGGPLSPRRVTQTLASLCDKSVVMRREGTYRMLDAIREYGRMWLADLGAEQEIADRHAEHLLARTRQAHHEWFGPAQRDWYRQVEILHADIRLAADYFLETDPASALEMIGYVTFFWVCSGYLYEARQYLERAIRLLPRHGDGEMWAQGLWSLALALTLQGEHEAARATVTDCKRAAAAALDAEALGRAAYLDGLLHLLEGRPMTAANVVRSMNLGTSDSHPGQVTAATALCRLVQVFALTGSGQLDHARHEALALREMCVALDEYWTRSYADHQLALIAVLEQRPRDAVRHARAVLDAKQHIGDAFGIAMAMDVLAIALADQGEAEAAAYAFGAATRFWETVGHPQRGTPEMASLREESEDRLVRILGPKPYARALERATTSDRRTLMLWGAHGGPLPKA